MNYKNFFTWHPSDWWYILVAILAIWLLVYPKPYSILMGILMIIPIAGIILNSRKKHCMTSLLKATKDKEGNKKYHLASYITAPAWLILCGVMWKYNLESFYDVLLPGAIIFVLMLIVLFRTYRLIPKWIKGKWKIYTNMIFHILLYSYGTTKAINCTYDASQPKIYKNKVLKKYVSSSVGGRYNGSLCYIIVESWNNCNENEKIYVSEEEYNLFEVGDEIEIALKKGVFNIPWYYIHPKN